MSTRENRQDKQGKKDFGKISVEEQKKLSKERLEEGVDREETNEDSEPEVAKNFDKSRALAEHFEDYSGRL